MAVTPISDLAHPEWVEPSLLPCWLGRLTGSLPSWIREGCRSLPPAMAKEGKRGTGKERLGNHWLQLGRIINLVGLDFPWTGALRLAWPWNQAIHAQTTYCSYGLTIGKMMRKAFLYTQLGNQARTSCVWKNACTRALSMKVECFPRPRLLPALSPHMRSGTLSSSPSFEVFWSFSEHGVSCPARSRDGFAFRDRGSDCTKPVCKITLRESEWNWVGMGGHADLETPEVGSMGQRGCHCWRKNWSIPQLKGHSGSFSKVREVECG